MGSNVRDGSSPSCATKINVVEKEEIIKQLTDTFGYDFEIGSENSCNNWSMISFHGHIPNTNKTKYVTISVSEIEDFESKGFCGVSLK